MKCLNCSKPTEKWGNSYKKYCNTTCRDRYFTKLKKVSYPEKQCPICSAIFTPKNSLMKFCSQLCSYENDKAKRSKKPKYKTCAVCNSQFEPYNSLDKYCSAGCRIKNMKSKRTWNWTDDQLKKRMGEKNPAFRHGLRTQSAKMDSTGLSLFHRNRDEYKADFIEKYGCLYCEHCGETNVYLESHHIIYRSEKPRHPFLHDKRNILLLCVKCHNAYHNFKGHRDFIVRERGLNLLFGDDVLDKAEFLTRN